MHTEIVNYRAKTMDGIVSRRENLLANKKMMLSEKETPAEKPVVVVYILTMGLYISDLQTEGVRL